MFSLIKSIFLKDNVVLNENILTNSLAPRDDNDNESQSRYEERLKAALQDRYIKNIALTGIYGSGKSTILNTFKRNYAKQWSFADISLSTFDTENNNDLDSDYLQLIERSILQQLFYSVDSAIIPLSRFKRIVKTTRKSQFSTFFLITIFFISYLIVFSENEKILAFIPDWERLPLAGLLILFLSSLTILYQVLGYAISLKEIKLTLYDAEFNITNEENKSILNDHIDEIIYFFQETKKNVVIIEDLDRFDNTTIFIRLRELNALINASCNHRIVFIYAIKDNMFKNTERSKFFEYIIPVIPIINPTNAYDLIRKNYGNVVENIDNRFLRKTCLYFDDMRLVKNILNEYQDYLHHLGELYLDKNQLFAMMVYKNHYPDEFAKLNANEGEIYHVFNAIKSEFIESRTDELENKIAFLQEKEEEVASEMLTSIDELNAIYTKFLNELLRKDNVNVAHINIEGRLISINAYDQAVFLDLIRLRNQKIQYRTLNSHYTQDSSHCFQDVEEYTGSNLGYIERSEIIKNKERNRLLAIKNQKNAFKKELESTRNQTMEALLQSGLELNVNEQLKFFILNGYINENYTDYISIFFESSISKPDKEYAMIVNARQIPNFNLELKNQNELLLNYLSEDEMLTSSVLNIDMLRYLIGVNIFEKHKENIIQKICDKSDVSIEFLTTLFSKNVDFLHILIPKLAQYDDSVFDEILSEVDDEQTIDNYSKIITHIGFSLDTLAHLTKKLREFLLSRVDYISFVMACLSNDKEDFQQFTLAIDPLFTHVDATDIELFNWLGEQNLFSIDIDIIKDCLVGNLPLSMEDVEHSLETAPLTIICQSNINYLISNFWRYINDYTCLFIMNLADGKYFTESEEVMIKVLNVEELNYENKEKLLSRTTTKITDITKIDNVLHDELFKYNVAHPNWSNVFEGFKRSGDELFDSLVLFINTNSEPLGSQREEYRNYLSEQEGLGTKIEIELIQCELLNDISYERVIKVLNEVWDNIDFTLVNKNKVLTLIHNQKLSLTNENWNHIIACDNNEVREAYIEHHVTSITSENLIENLQASDYITIIDSDKINKPQKQLFIEEYADEIPTTSRDLYAKVINIFDDNKLSNKLYESIKTNATAEGIQHLCLAQINYLDKDEIVELLPLMGAPFNELNEVNMTRFDNNQHNNKLLTALHHKKIIIKPVEKTPVMMNVYYQTRLQKRS